MMNPKDVACNTSGVSRTKWGKRCGYEHYDEVKELFDKWAFGVDDDPSLTTNYDSFVRGHYEGPKRLFKLVEPFLSPNEEVFDICCGSGLSGEPFILRDFVVRGCDISRRMLEKARRRGYKEVVAADIFQDTLPWRDTFRFAVSVGAFGEWVPMGAALEKVFPVFQEGKAVFAFTTEVEHSDLNEMSTLLEGAGFSIEKLDKGCGFRNSEYGTDEYYYVVACR